MISPGAQPPSFKQISYSNTRQINYLSDIAAMGPKHVLFLQSLNYNQTKDKQLSTFDTIADDLYKKIVRQNLDRPSQISRKTKKGDSQINYYNSNDPFINDQDCCIQKKDISSSIEQYKSVQINSLEEFYNSEIYQKKIEEIIIEVGKRKTPEQFIMIEQQDFQKFDQVRKNIRNSILNRNNKFTNSEAQINDKTKDNTTTETQKQTITLPTTTQTTENNKPLSTIQTPSNNS